MKKLLTILAVLALCLSCQSVKPKATASQPAQEPVPNPNQEPTICKRTDQKITIDGVMESAWLAAPVIKSFRVPPKGLVPNMQTEARMMWDDQNIYIFYKAYDMDVWAYETVRDGATCNNDCLEFFMAPAPGPEAKSYVNFEINALGTIYDAYTADRNLRMAFRWQYWDCPNFQHAVKIQGTLNNPRDEDEGWTLEMAIPWTSLPWMKGREIPKADEKWSCHLARYDWSMYQPDGCELTTTAPFPKVSFHLVDWFVPLVFVR